MDATAAHRDVLHIFDALFATLTQQRDGDAGTRLFAADDDIVMWGSDEPEQAVGPDAVGHLHRGIAGASAGLEFRWQVRHVHVERETAWVNAAGEVTIDPPGQESRTMPYRVTAIFVRRGTHWRWHTFNGSIPSP